MLAPFFPDLDGDGVGAGEATYACVAPEHFSALSSDCDDRQSAIAPGLDEACDGIDNNCSGGPDDAFACVKDQPTACTTQCGSTGSGTCSGSCELPAPANCTIPAETCNLADDDCDGLSDENFFKRLPDVRYWTGEASVNSSYAAAVPKEGGGGWVISDPNDSNGFYVESLDAEGNSTGALVTAHAETVGLNGLKAVGNGRWVVLAAGGLPARVELRRASDLSLVATRSLEAFPLHVAMQEDDQGVRIAVLMRLFSSGLKTGLISFSWVEDAWLPDAGSPLVATTVGASVDALDYVLAPIPCRSEWLVGVTSRSSWQPGQSAEGTLRRADLNGALLPSGTLTVPDAFVFSGSQAGAFDCTKSDPQLLVGTSGIPDTRSSRVFKVTARRDTGALLLSGSSTLGTVIERASFASLGGQWYWAGTKDAGSQAGEPVMGELNFQMLTPPLQAIELIPEDSPNPGASNSPDGQHVSLTFLGRKLAATFSKASEAPSGSSNLVEKYAAAFPESSSYPLAISYLVGCP